MPMRVLETELRQCQLRTRMPFRYGIATMTEVPLVFVRVTAEVEGKTVSGVSSDCLPPKWFTKIPEKGIEEEIAEMTEVILHAMALADGMTSPTAFEAWQAIYCSQLEWGDKKGYPPLLANFGTSLVERAMIEAVCRAAGQPFAAVLRSNKLGMDLGRIHPSLKGREPSALLAFPPPQQVTARHTVGLGDPLTPEEIPEADRLNDGLPQALSSCIEAYGIGHFKIKVTGNLEADLARLREIQSLLASHGDYAFTLDGNEQFKDWATFREFWEAAVDGAGDFFGHLLFVEQPLHRDVALNEDVAKVLQEWATRPPLIIDESDGTLDALPTALRLGYAGTSHKNCKGVFKGVANACLLQQRRVEAAGRPAIMSGEDLCTTGPVSLLQDLAVMAALGVTSVERNGHHYHPGLSQLPKAVQQQVADNHPDLYRASASGWPTLRIENGAIDLTTVNAAPFGVGFELNQDAFTVVEPTG